jgi:hypothetical protein
MPRTFSGAAGKGGVSPGRGQPGSSGETVQVVIKDSPVILRQVCNYCDFRPLVTNAIAICKHSAFNFMIIMKSIVRSCEIFYLCFHALVPLLCAVPNLHEHNLFYFRLIRSKRL